MAQFWPEDLKAFYQILVQEVVNVELDAIWQTFAETGDPVCYMLYKAAQNGRPRQESDSGESPRVSD